MGRDDERAKQDGPFQKAGFRHIGRFTVGLVNLNQSYINARGKDLSSYVCYAIVCWRALQLHAIVQTNDMFSANVIVFDEPFSQCRTDRWCWVAIVCGSAVLRA